VSAPKVMKNRFCSATTLPGSIIRAVEGPAVQRSCFSTEESWAVSPPKVIKTASVQQLLSLEAALSPLSSRPKRSAVEGPAVQRSHLGNVFRQRSHGP